MDADTRARLISLGIDPDKQEVPSSTAPTLADHLTALAELLKPAVAPEAAPLPAPVEVSPLPEVPVAPLARPEPAPAEFRQLEQRVVETVATPEPTPAPVAIITPPPPPYRPIEQVYTAPEPVKAADAEPFAEPVIVTNTPRAGESAEATAARSAESRAAYKLATEPVEAPTVVTPEAIINYSPSGRYLEAADLANDPQVVEFKKNHTMATQVDGNHYVKCAIQPLDYIMANKLGFVEGNIVKYATRWQDKDGVVDLKKARDYLDKLIAYVEAAS